jgi:hypothetical protein
MQRVGSQSYSAIEIELPYRTTSADPIARQRGHHAERKPQH